MERDGQSKSNAAWRAKALVMGLVATVTAYGAATTAGATCLGDCNGDGMVSVNEIIQGVNIALGTAPISACASFDGNADGRVTVSEIISAVNSALNGCPQEQAFVLTTDFQTGSFATILLDAPHTVSPSSPGRSVNSDAVARTFGGQVYVLNRFNADNIQVLDPSHDFATVSQCSTGSGSNPQDIAVVGSTAYITRNSVPQLLIANLAAQPDCSDFMAGTIDLSAFADADGNPDMTQMALVDNTLYVALDRLDSNFQPAENGAIVAIDTTTNQPLDAITLTGENPFAQTKGLTVRNGALIIAEAGKFGVNDGGIERVNLATQMAEGFFITEAALGGDIADFVMVSDQLGYAIVSKSDFTNTLVAFDPVAGAVTQTLVSGANLADIELDDRGDLYLADRDATHPGIRIFRASDGVEQTSAPLDLSLPPFDILFLQ